jgi:CTD kinase subunit gamma
LIKERDVGGTHPFTGAEEGTKGSAAPNAQSQVRNGGGAKLEKRLVEQRIEEDRERHKRSRESIWAVPGEGEEEMDRMWDEASDIGEDDYVLAGEENEERKRVIVNKY